MNDFLSVDIVNEGRQKELDLAKGIAIILMVFCHVGIYFYPEDSALYIISDIIGGEFAAPSFMVCLGVGTIYSKHNSPKQLAKRGLITLLYAHLLNFFRETIFIIIGEIIGKPYTFNSAYESFMMVDIMGFAAMAFLILALFKKLKLSSVQQFMIGLLLTGLGEVLAWKSTGNLYLDSIFGYIWGTYENTYFPLLNWIIFPVTGVMFGEVLQHCNNKTKLYKHIFLIGLIGVIFSYYQIFTDPYGYYNNDSYYFMGIKDVIFALCYPITLFSICQYIADKTIIEDLPIVGFCSKYLNSIYCVSWVIIMGSRYFIYDVFNINLGNLTIIAMMFLILFISYAIVKVYVNKKQNRYK